jgi:hypothetical protein
MIGTTNNKGWPVMNLTPPVRQTKQSVWPWLCSASPTVAALALALLAVHGWILGESAFISENKGPALFDLHFLVMGILALFATWVAAPAWVALYLSRTFRQPVTALFLQVLVFAAGWLLVFGAMILIEASPARHAF